MFKHEIGLDYTDIVKSRKNKRQLPLIGKLPYKFNIKKLVEELSNIVVLNEELAYSETGKDKASNENNYNLKDKNNKIFIDNYKEIYKLYAVIGFQSLSTTANQLAATTSVKMEDLSPYDRARGMRQTSSKWYHPHYDERNYTQPTEYYTGEFAKALDSFDDEVCRSGTVCLHPGKFLSPHFDIGPEYVTRLHIPLVTNTKAIIGLRSKTNKDIWEVYHLPADGHVYFVNSGYEHFAVNEGSESRYHIRICLNGQLSLKDIVDIKPNYTLTDKYVQQAPYNGTENNPRNNYTGISLKEMDLDKNYNKYSDIAMDYLHAVETDTCDQKIH